MTTLNNSFVFFIFGLSGVGKSYVGEHLAQQMDISFFDADEELTDLEIAHLSNSTFTDEMRDRYHVRLVEKVKEKIATGQSIIVGACLVKQRHRDLFLNEFGDQIKFIYLEAKDEVILQRLRQRKHFFSVENYRRLLANYDPVSESFPCLQLSQNGDRDVLPAILNYLTDEKKFIQTIH